jgi:hypothetical protein
VGAIVMRLPSVGVRRRVLAVAGVVAVVAGAEGCARAIAPLAGTPAAATFPPTKLVGSRQLVFRWEYTEDMLIARGEGIARLAGPDSARLDFFVDGGFGSGYALVFDDSIFAPGGNLVQNMLPSPPMIWAAVGRLAVPASSDTAAIVDGARLVADIGRDPMWRVTFDGGRLAMLERVVGGKVAETLTRAADGSVRYQNPRSRRMLRITVTRDEPVPAFDASIWRP